MEALILIDPAFLPELSDQILYELDILLDPQGKTELVYLEFCQKTPSITMGGDEWLFSEVLSVRTKKVF